MLPSGRTRKPKNPELSEKGGACSGRQMRGETVIAERAGVRVRALNRPMTKEWTTPEPLFNGTWESFDITLVRRRLRNRNIAIPVPKR